jgi:hypothetical protein
MKCRKRKEDLANCSATCPTPSPASVSPRLEDVLQRFATSSYRNRIIVAASIETPKQTHPSITGNHPTCSLFPDYCYCDPHCNQTRSLSLHPISSPPFPTTPSQESQDHPNQLRSAQSHWWQHQRSSCSRLRPPTTDDM